MSAKKDSLVYEGTHFEVVFYYDDSLEIPIWSTYESLSENEKIDFLVRVKKIADSKPGTIHPKSIFNIEDKSDKIFAIKFGANRFCTFFTRGRKLIITNGYIKKSQKNTKKINEELKKAKNFKKDYETRIKNGTY